MFLNIFFSIINIFYLLLFEHIVLDFTYYYFDSLIYTGDLFFWESEFTMLAISLLLFFSKIFKNKKKSQATNNITLATLLISFLWMLYAIFLKNFTFNFLTSIFVLSSFLLIFLEYFLFVKNGYRILFYFIILSFNFYGLMMCQIIFPMKDIPESFKFKKVNTELRKFIIKTKFKQYDI